MFGIAGDHCLVTLASFSSTIRTSIASRRPIVKTQTTSSKGLRKANGLNIRNSPRNGTLLVLDSIMYQFD
jgi:hypothetical protein